MGIDYNAVIEILKNFLNNENTETLGISVGEERQVRDAIKNLLTAYEKEKELLELASNMLDNIDYGQIPIAIGELKSELEKEKEKNKSLLQCLKDSQERCENEHLFLGNPDM